MMISTRTTQDSVAFDLWEPTENQWYLDVQGGPRVRMTRDDLVRLALICLSEAARSAEQ